MLEAFIQKVMNEQYAKNIFLCFNVFDHIPSAFFVSEAF